MDGGDGTDNFSFSLTDRTSGIVIDLANMWSGGTGQFGTGSVTGFEMFGGAWGTQHADQITIGWSGATSIFGLGGDDILSAGSGDDTLDGGTGDDTLHGGDGNDTLIGGDGTDTVRYDTSSAGVWVSLSTSNAQDTAGSGLDTLYGFENLVGSAFDDTLAGNALNNVLSGGLGIDSVSYAASSAGVSVSLLLASAQNTVGDGIDTLSGFENLIGSGFGDSLTGNAGANRILGGAGNDSLFGDNGADVLDGGAGDDILDGGKKTDTASYASALAAVTVSLGVATAQNTGGAGIDTLIGFEALEGSAFGDSLTGNDEENTLTGGAGDDVLDGGKGNDALNGGDGVDTASYTLSAAGITANLTNGKATGAGKDTLTGIENLTGSAFKDVFTGDGGANLLLGGAGNDSLDGGAGDDLLDGGADRDIASYASAAAGVTVSLALAGAQNTFGAGLDTLISIEDLTGSGFNDILTGDALSNLLTGGAGNDSLDGGDGSDTLLGGNGGDSLLGGLANDNLTGGTGADFLTGGAGKDRFIYLTASESTKSATDLITDLAASDVLDLSAIDADTITAGDQAFVRVGAFSGVAGQYSLTFDAITGQSLLQADVNGDSRADLIIAFTGDVTSMTAGWVL